MPLFLAFLQFCSGCNDNPTGPEQGSPDVRVISPDLGNYDSDDDGLVDVAVQYSDELSGIEVASVQLRSEQAALGLSQAENLLNHWEVASIDSTGFIVEETLEALLPRGPNRLTVTVKDRVGNETAIGASFSLPIATLHRVLDLDATISRPTATVLIPDNGPVGFVAIEEVTGSAIAVVDLEDLDVLGTARTSTIGLSQMAWDPVRKRVYAQSYLAPVLAVFDVAARSFLPSIPLSSRSFDVTISPDGNKAYVSLEVEGSSNGFISVVDLPLAAESTVLDLGVSNSLNPGTTLGMRLAIRDDGAVLFGLTHSFASAGLLIVDLLSEVLKRQVRVWPGPHLGGGNDIDYVSGHLVTASTARDGSGSVVVFSEPDYEVTSFGLTGAFLVPRELDSSPDGLEYGLTLTDQGAGFHAVQLMNVASLSPVWEYRFPPGSTIPRGFAFGLNGRVFAVVGSTIATLHPMPAQLLVFLRR